MKTKHYAILPALVASTALATSANAQSGPADTVGQIVTSGTGQSSSILSGIATFMPYGLAIAAALAIGALLYTWLKKR